MTEAASSRLNAESTTDAALPTRRELREQREREAAASSGRSPHTQPGSALERVEMPLVPSAAETNRIPLPDAAQARTVRSSVKRAAAASAPLQAALSGPPSKPAPKRNKRGFVGSIVTFAVVPGLFLTAALPAYAFVPGTDGISFGASGARDASEAGAQSVDIASFSPEVVVASDGFAAVSGEEIQRLTLEAQRQAEAQAAEEAAASRVRSGASSSPGVRQEGDDYPWAFELTDDQGGGLSPLRYYYRECVDFVAWRLNRDAGATGPFKWTWANMTPGGGSAYNWANEWSKNGWATSYDPVPGAVAWFTSGNHVAYVQSVPGDGTVVLEEYNWNNDHSYHRRTVPIGEVSLYLYPPP